MVDSYERGTQVVLVPNPHYWGKGEDGKPLPYVDKVVLRYMPDSNSRVLGLQNGDIRRSARSAAQPGRLGQGHGRHVAGGLARPTGSTMSISTTPRSRSTTSASGWR